MYRDAKSGKWRRLLGAFPKNSHGEGFTLVELIVVITILAVLATVGFLSLSGYSDDARSSATKANVRMVYSAIATESATTGNSPRYYVSHDAAAALSGTVTVGNVSLTLSGGDWNVVGTNYSSGNPRWDLLKLNPDKFRVSASFWTSSESAFAAYDSGAVTVGAVDVPGQPTISGKKRTSSVFQVAAVSKTKAVLTMGNYSAASGTDVQGLVKDPAAGSATTALVEGVTAGGFSCGSSVTALGETYATVSTPDGKCWTKENMRHGTMLPSAGTAPSNASTVEKWCYGGSTSNCTTYGALYTFNEAMGLPYGSNSNGYVDVPENTANSVCGKLGAGWHVPTFAEWNGLKNAGTGGTGWLGNKLFGTVTALGGDVQIGQYYSGPGTYGSFWSSTKVNGSTTETRAWFFQLFWNDSAVNMFGAGFDDTGFSVKCVK